MKRRHSHYGCLTGRAHAVPLAFYQHHYWASGQFSRKLTADGRGCFDTRRYRTAPPLALAERRNGRSAKHYAAR